MADTPVILATGAEDQKISRFVLAWANSWPNIPDGINRINYAQFTSSASGEPLTPGMMLSTVAAYIGPKYITGGYRGEYQFALVYRIKPKNSNGDRLEADEALNDFGDWAVANPPTLGDGVVAVKVDIVARGSFVGSYENGDESHQIPLKLTYDVFQ